MAKNVIVTGMARSGTSMTVAALRRYGYWVVDDERAELQSADRFNPSGYWEPSAILEANRAVLKAAGFEHDNTWMFDPISTAIAKKISELTPLPVDRELVARYREHQPWVWKDPRFCFTLPYWLQQLDPEEISVLPTCYEKRMRSCAASGGFSGVVTGAKSLSGGAFFSTGKRPGRRFPRPG